MRGSHGFEWAVIVLVIIGAINMGLIGIFHYDLIATVFSHVPVLGRVVYILIGFSGLYALFMMFRGCCKK